MIKGAWIVTLREMRCKNWMNGLEIVFHLGKNGQPEGSILPPSDKFWAKTPKTLDMALFLRRMLRRATVVFYQVYYRRLLKTQYGPIIAAHSH
jgi:hypothetical protein